MNKITKIVLLLILGLCISEGAQADNQPEGLTLKAARRLALANNPQVKEMAQRLRAAEYVLRQAKSARFPTITASGGYTQVSINLQPESNPLIRVDDSYQEATGEIQLTWLLFDGFASSARIHASASATNTSTQALLETQRLLLQGVTAAFHQSQLAIEKKIISQQDRDFNRSLEKDARIRWEAGAAPEAEMLTFSVNALMAEASLLQALRDYDIACTVIAELLALPDAKLPQAMQPVREQSSPARTIPDWLTETAFALSHRPDLAALQSQMESLEQLIRVEKGSMYPSVALIAGAETTNRRNISPVDQNNRDQYVGVAASWDLFTGGRDLAKIREAQANRDALNERLQQKELQIKSSIRQSIATADMARQTWLIQKQAYDLSQKIRDHVEKAYKAGTASLTRLNQVQTDLVRSAGATAAARIAFVMALANLDAETGRVMEQTE